jgi:ABC-2 type transport system ATP-binding protein
MDKAINKANPIIKAEHLTKQFGAHKAVDDISFHVDRGEIFAFLGPNGAGKSTTIKMLTTLLQPTSGSLVMAGHDVTKAQHDARQVFGIVFQDPSLDEELTAYENMMLHAALYKIPSRAAKEKTHKLLELLDLDGRKNDLVKTFSGGMRRRLEIARALLHQPKVLFLDEPTLGLDTQTRNLLWEYVTQLSHENGMTIFFTTHYLEEAQKVAGRIAIIDNGKIVATGTTAQLMQQTKTDSLEGAYLKLTGEAVRDEKISSGDNMAMRVRTVRSK